MISLKGLALHLLTISLLLVATQAQAVYCLLDEECDGAGRFNGFVAPMTMPFLFEDPFTTTEISSYVVHHRYPTDSVFQGGDATVIAVQARVALTSRLSVIATKDGYTIHRPKNPILRDEEGFFDITAGLKYAAIRRPEDNLIVSPTLRFQIPVGSSDVYSGNGSGAAIPGVSAAWGFDSLHLVGDLGFQLPFDFDAQTSFFYYNLHTDWRVTEWFSPFLALNGTHWTSSGRGRLRIDTTLGVVDLSTAQALLGTGGFEGADVVNLGSEDMHGADLVTLSVGARFALSSRVNLGAAYDFPVTQREDIFRDRFSFNVMVGF